MEKILFLLTLLVSSVGLADWSVNDPSPSECGISVYHGSIYHVKCDDGSSVVYVKGDDEVIVKDHKDSIGNGNSVDVEQSKKALDELLRQPEISDDVNQRIQNRIETSLSYPTLEKFNELLSSIESSNGGNPEEIDRLIQNAEAAKVSDAYEFITETYKDRAKEVGDLIGPGGGVVSHRDVSKFFDVYTKGNEKLSGAIENYKSSGRYESLDAELGKTLDSIGAMNRFHPDYEATQAATSHLIGTYSNDGVIADINAGPNYEVSLKTNIYSKDVIERYNAIDIRRGINSLITASKDNPTMLEGTTIYVQADSALARGSEDHGYLLMDRAETFKHYAQGGSYEISFTPEARALFSNGETSQDFIGHEVIDVSNRIADIIGGDVNSTNSEAALFARISLGLASGSDNLQVGLFHLEQASQVIPMLRGIALNIARTPSRIADKLIYTYDNPEVILDTGLALIAAVTNIPGTFQKMYAALKAENKEFWKMSREQQAGIAGDMAGDFLFGLGGGWVVNTSVKSAMSLAYLNRLESYSEVLTKMSHIDGHEVVVETYVKGLNIENSSQMLDLVDGLEKHLGCGILAGGCSSTLIDSSFENLATSSQRIGLGGSYQDRAILAEQLKQAGKTTGGRGEFDEFGRMERISQDREILIQEGRTTCGPTSCGMVLNDYGIDVPVAELVREVGPQATYNYQLLPLLTSRGVSARLGGDYTRIADLERYTRNGRPVIVQVNGASPQVGHWVVFDGITTRLGEKVVAIRDPALGRYYEKLESFENRYKPWVSPIIPNKGKFD